MNILLASSSSGSRGGGELYLLYLGRALAERGHHVTLWVSSHPRMDELAQSFAAFGSVQRSEYTNTYDRRARSITAYLDRSTSARVAAEWRDAKPDFIHLNKQNLEDGLDLLGAATGCGIPSLCTIHLTQSAKYLRAVFAAPRDLVSRRALLAYAGPLVTVLEGRRKDLADFLGDSPRLHTIPNGVPLFALTQREAARSAKRDELGIAKDALLISAVGRMVPQKRPIAFLEQAERVLAEMPATQFLWIGDGGLSEEWDARVAERKLGASVRRLPWQSDVGSWLLASDVFLHVAEFEGLPLAILEAMSAELPCAISKNLLGEMPFLNDSNSIAADDEGRWIEHLGDPAGLAARGAAARQLAEQEFSFGKMAERYEALYRKTLESTR